MRRAVLRATVAGGGLEIPSSRSLMAFFFGGGGGRVQLGERESEMEETHDFRLKNINLFS